MAGSLWYPSVEDVLTIHDDIVSEYAETQSGVQNSGDIEFALDYIEKGSFGTLPETIHEKRFTFFGFWWRIIRSSMQTSALHSTRRLCSIFSMDIDSSTTTISK